MSKPRTIKIGLCGLGTVGQGVWQHLERARTDLEARLGVTLELARAAVRDLKRARDVAVPADKLTDDALSIARDPSIQIVCELIGGTTLAREVTMAALERGAVVVSANKALLSEHGAELFAAARKHGGQIYFEASVAGGIPIIKALREGLVANRFPQIYGILNGTCNYILTRMESAGLAFDAALKEAQEQGFAEADPTDDLEGYDARAKLCILARVGLGLDLEPADVPCESLRTISDDDFVYARRLQATIRQVSRVTSAAGEVEARVGPALVPLTSPLARVIGSQNLIVAGGAYGRETTFSGYGAGGFPTAVAVVSDLLAIARRVGGAPAAWPATRKPASVTNLKASPYYLRLVVRDQPGIIASLASIFSRHDINIDAVLQEPGNSKDRLPFVITLESCPTHSIEQALAEVRTLPFHVTPPLCLPVLQ